MELRKRQRALAWASWLLAAFFLAMLAYESYEAGTWPRTWLTLALMAGLGVVAGFDFWRRARGA
jgi:hypothetical protein